MAADTDAPSITAVEVLAGTAPDAEQARELVETSGSGDRLLGGRDAW